jgi:hypothetical protein
MSVPRRSDGLCARPVADLRRLAQFDQIEEKRTIVVAKWRTFALGAAALFAFLLVGYAQEPGHGQGTSSVINQARFWQLVDASAAFEASPSRQLAALGAALAGLSLEEIERFEAAFDHEMKRSYSWDLWGAAYIIHGGSSDDGFEYFRCWLISKGQRIFEKVLADPDSLADFLAQDTHGVLEFESFAYVARKTWSDKTGKPSNLMPNAAWMMYPGKQPSGVPFEEDPIFLAKRYPKLWKRFGDAPLG